MIAKIYLGAFLKALKRLKDVQDRRSEVGGIFYIIFQSAVRKFTKKHHDEMDTYYGLLNFYMSVSLAP